MQSPKTAALLLVLLLGLPLFGAACAPVGSEAWCKKMEEKSKVDWTPREAADFARYCVL